MKLQEILVREVFQVAPDESVGAAAKRMREKSAGCLVVTVNGAVKGIITDRDLLACLARVHDPFQCKVSAHMSRPVIVLRPEEDHVTAAEVMRTKRIKRLPVARGGKLLGIISMSDLAAIASDEAERLRSSLSFFTSVIRAQSSQANRSLHAAPAKSPMGSVAHASENEVRAQSLDNGGPG